MDGGELDEVEDLARRWVAAKRAIQEAVRIEFELRQKLRLLLRPDMAVLSDREREVFRLMSQKKQNKEIAAELGITLRTVKFHVSCILKKLDKPSRADLWA